MEVRELRCTSCFAPIDLSRGAVSRCPYCGATMVVEGGNVVAAPPTAGGVYLEDAGASKIAVIKVVREHTGLGLKGAKELVERAPCEMPICEDANLTAAFRAELMENGAKVR